MPIERLEARRTDVHRTDGLALLGGWPIRSREWPKWPRASASTQRNILDVLHSTKWTLSGQSERTLSYERRFARAFAYYCGVRHAVPCGSGSAALTIALQALDIGPGDEVIVPGIAWVACASSVCNVGATPVPADVDPNSLCMTADKARKVLNDKTKAIMLVHLYSSLAPANDLEALAREENIALIEDASHAHGATVNKRKTGSFGAIGVFSMQQSKLLTGGEGGICLTNDLNLYRKMQQLRADGRVYNDEVDEKGRTDQVPYSEIRHVGEILGRNLCLSEFHAAILLDRLEDLDAENEHRREMFAELVSRLKNLPGISPITGEMSNHGTHYRVCLQLDSKLLSGLDVALVAKALTAELRLPVEEIDPPLSSNPLFSPASSPLHSRLKQPARWLRSLPVAENAARSCITFPHWCLLGDQEDTRDIVNALEKVLFSNKEHLVNQIGKLL